jgi:hypothetical protein
MKIKDINVDDVRAGMNWRVLNPDKLLEPDFLMEDLEIEPLGQYIPSDTLVYSGIWVYLKDLGEPRSDISQPFKRDECECLFPPEDPKDLEQRMIPVVEPLLMVKEVQESGWDYCEYVEGQWRQVGLKPNPDAPLTNEYFANPVQEDEEFDVCGDDLPLREIHKRGFRNWIEFLQV